MRGRLVTASGRALAGRAVGVRLVSEDRARRVRTVRSGRDGRFALALVARRAGVLALHFAGDGETLPSEERLALSVPAPVTIDRPPARVRGGEAVRFSGRVRGRPLPRRGKLVEVQAHFRGRWRTISTVRSARGGRWRFAYSFRAGAGVATYRLRARVPAEAGYPFAAGASRPIRVTVGGRA